MTSPTAADLRGGAGRAGGCRFPREFLCRGTATGIGDSITSCRTSALSGPTEARHPARANARGRGSNAVGPVPARRGHVRTRMTTRRFCDRPCAVLFGAAGRSSP